MGNYTGYGEKSAQCVNEILSFRRQILSGRGVLCSDISYLRGQQEEMFQHLVALAFAPKPMETLIWLLGNGMDATLRSYGVCPHDGISACRSGIPFIIKWVKSVQDAIRRYDGHETFANHQVRALYTRPSTLDYEPCSNYALLFVHAGLDIQKPLKEQNYDLWWGYKNFEKIDTAFDPFQKVFRGYDPTHKGLKMGDVTVTLDAGCGFGGSLVCAGLDQSGQVFDLIEA